MSDLRPAPILNEFSKTLGLDYPIIVAPMFLVSNVAMMIAAGEAGAIGVFPALNFRPIEKYQEALKEIRRGTQRPFGVNVIVHQSNVRQSDDLKFALDAGVPFFITSLGNPKVVIDEAHRQGAKVYCDVTNLEHALKVQDLGADGVIAVGSGAGGHAGPISPLVLIPWLKEKLQIPVVAAGGIANGVQMAGAVALGASAVSMGTRFIASVEAAAAEDYKQAIVRAEPEDIVLTRALSGTPAAVINNDYVKKLGSDLPWLLRMLKKQKWLKGALGAKAKGMAMKRLLADAPDRPSWKTVWSAGQSVGLVHDVLPTRELIFRLAREYHAAKAKMP